MPHPRCFPGSTFGSCPDLYKNFLSRPEQTSIYWDDSFLSAGYDDSFFKTMHQCEPVSVLNIIDPLIARHREFDLILAHDERVLRECPNAKFLGESGCSWFSRSSMTQDSLGNMSYGDGIIHKNPVVPNYVGCSVEAKRFAVSFLTSSKTEAQGHKLRQEVFDRLPDKVGEVVTWKHRSPPVVPDKRTVLEPYQYSIVIENSAHNNYYTEKIVDAFVARTVPVYWGCPNLGTHFNMDGVVTFSNYDDLFNKLQSLTPETYARMLPAVEENFHIALKGVYQWDLIEHYISEGIDKKHTLPVPQIAVMPISVTPISVRRPPRPLRHP